VPRGYKTSVLSADRCMRSGSARTRLGAVYIFPKMTEVWSSQTQICVQCPSGLRRVMPFFVNFESFEQCVSMQNALVQGVDSEWADLVARLVAEAGILNEDVEAHVRSAFTKVDRRSFVEEQWHSRACQDVDLPLGNDQWLGRPSLLIRVAGLVNLQKRMRILVAGSGSGYLCAALHSAGARVFGVEQIAALAQGSRKLLDSLGHHGVVIHRGNASKGWPEVAPFDAMIVTYPVSDDLGLPISQLSLNGNLVVPVVSEKGAHLTVWKRNTESYKRTVFEEVECR
jgi:protein-L-isoaspartate(D-aspartate) O-methyltransferase